MRHRIRMAWTDINGYICLRGNMLEQLFRTHLHAVHVRDSMSAFHVIHYIEVAHFIIRSTAVLKKDRYLVLISHLAGIRKHANNVCVNSFML